MEGKFNNYLKNKINQISGIEFNSLMRRIISKCDIYHTYCKIILILNGFLRSKN